MDSDEDPKVREVPSEHLAAHRHARIVVGVDGSFGAEAALRWAIREARERGLVLDVVAVWEDLAGEAGDGHLAVARERLDRALDARAAPPRPPEAGDHGPVARGARPSARGARPGRRRSWCSAPRASTHRRFPAASACTACGTAASRWCSSRVLRDVALPGYPVTWHSVTCGRRS
ncbi:universal stress protein [Yinghuangia aomiensis]